MLPIGDTIPSRQPPVTTWLLIGANALVFFAQLSVPAAALERAFHVFGIVPVRYTQPGAWTMATGLEALSVWPLLTSQFLHGGWLHILANMWTLWIFGDNVEERMGSLRFAIFYLLCGVIASVLHILMNPDSTIPAVGASGAIAGVLGAYLVLFPMSRIIAIFPVLFYPFFFELPAVVYIGLWFFSQLFSGTLALAAPSDVGGVAWWAHVGGFIAGLLALSFFLAGSRRRRSRYPDDGWIEPAWVRHG